MEDFPGIEQPPNVVDFFRRGAAQERLTRFAKVRNHLGMLELGPGNCSTKHFLHCVWAFRLQLCPVICQTRIGYRRYEHDEFQVSVGMLAGCPFENSHLYNTYMLDLGAALVFHISSKLKKLPISHSSSQPTSEAS
jgi:hypothetical protein